MATKKTPAEVRPQSQFFSPAKSAKLRALSIASLSLDARADAAADTSAGVSVRDVLRNKLLEKQQLLEDAKARGDDEWDNAKFVQLDRETSDHVKSLIQQSDAIKRVRKERIFEDEVTEEEMDIIKQRVALQQKQFAEFERREFAHKAERIRQMYSYLADEEIREALKEGRNDVDEVIYQFSTPGYLMKLRKEIALRHTPLTQTPQMTDVQRVKYEELLKKRTKIQKKTTTSENRDKYRTIGRLPLDDALAQLQRAAAAKNGSGIDLSRAMKGWSEARIKAFKAIKTKPNTYYYRFNAPGEEQRTGPWTPEEQKLFHQRLKEIGANGQWGVFSMTIPGRVGYQCSNYYRYLVENRLIHDPNYVLDEKGKAHYLFTTKKKNPDGTAMRVFRKHKKPHAINNDAAGKSSGGTADASPTPASSTTASASTRKSTRAATVVRKRKRRGRYADNSSDEDVIRANDVELSDDANDGGDTSDGEYHDSSSSKRRRGPSNESDESGFESDEAGAGADPTNPLPDLIDPITLEPVCKPAISPYGHVMGYNSWVRCLMFPPEGSQRNICPLTKKPLSKRDLVILTFDNIEQYRDKITNL
ncbi:hypothetical protein DL89DRAFT_236482 [Linderina pennispora]|uniref:Myb-like domain-containing protein n=1 Tax=Linderina pennispora TaxID=61395 RepID=A0A1Y1W566_9FUNG|nr:uncharacterized protein DL89DRAFT_236482 [Linderina pennispora]ORX68667.1 hypothetical protein DL89DRAFT_236482 [Linderina pennispora]